METATASLGNEAKRGEGAAQQDGLEFPPQVCFACCAYQLDGKTVKMKLQVGSPVCFTRSLRGHRAHQNA